MIPTDALITELEEAFATGSAERRAKTLRRITDLFVFGAEHFSEDHLVLFDNIFDRMISDIEESARAALSERLATVPNAPPSVIRKLAFDDAIGVAGPVLERSEAIDNVTLVENANTKSQQHLLAISQRKKLPETVTDVLVERGNREVKLNTVRNRGAQISEAGYVRLVKQSENDDELAESVGSRPEIPRGQFLKLLSHASHSVRRKLETANPQFASEIQQVVADVATAIQTKAAAASHDYVAARALVESLQVAGHLGEAEIEAFARSKKFEETAVALAISCNLPIDIVERALVQEDSGTILIIMKSIGLSWLTAKAVLLMRSGDRGVSHAALEGDMVNYMRLKPTTAQKVIEYQRQHRGNARSFVV